MVQKKPTVELDGINAVRTKQKHTKGKWLNSYV